MLIATIFIVPSSPILYLHASVSVSESEGCSRSLILHLGKPKSATYLVHIAYKYDFNYWCTGIARSCGGAHDVSAKAWL